MKSLSKSLIDRIDAHGGDLPKKIAGAEFLREQANVLTAELARLALEAGLNEDAAHHERLMAKVKALNETACDIWAYLGDLRLLLAKQELAQWRADLPAEQVVQRIRGEARWNHDHKQVEKFWEAEEEKLPRETANHPTPAPSAPAQATGWVLSGLSASPAAYEDVAVRLR